MSEKSKEKHIGTLVKLRKRAQELYEKIEKLETLYQGPFKDAFEKKYTDLNDPERLFKAQMSIDPDRIIALAKELKTLQKKYAEAHKAVREFEKLHPQIAKTLGTYHY